MSKYFKVKVIKHTPLEFAGGLCDTWLVDKVGKILLVKEAGWSSAFYETKIENGVSILKSDCILIKGMNDTNALNFENADKIRVKILRKL